MSNARRESRIPAAGKAWLAAKGYGTARVTLLDQSQHGARLSVPLGLRSGSIVILWSDDEVSAAGGRRGVVRWIKADSVGVQFTSADRVV